MIAGVWDVAIKTPIGSLVIEYALAETVALRYIVVVVGRRNPS